MRKGVPLYLRGVSATYQALYRKYRPRTFDDVWGQEQVTDTLRRQVETGRVSHAYLFVGTRGTGKTTCAKLLARAVNCEHPVNGSPCNECAACRAIENGTNMDVVEIDAASNNGVDNIRALRDEAVFSPASVKMRVYIVDEVHMLSGPAFNALLKILEEPPEHLMFILATTELRKVPATILSRCQRFNFHRLDADVISRRLKYVAERESIKLTPGAADMLARLADGGMRDALSLLDQCSGRETVDEAVVLDATGAAGALNTEELLDAVAARDIAKALALFDRLWRDGMDPASVLGSLMGLMRDSLLLSVAPRGAAALISGAYSREALGRFARAFTREELLRDMAVLQSGVNSLRDSPSPRTTAELALVSLCDASLSADSASLSARLSRVEAALSLGVEPRRLAPVDITVENPVENVEYHAPEPVNAPSPPAEEPVYDDAPPPPGDGDAPPWDEPEPPAPSPAPAPATEPAAHEAPAPEPEPERPAPAGDGGFWSAVLDRAGVFRAPYPMFLRTPGNADGVLDGDTALVRLASGVLYNGLSTGENLEKLRAIVLEAAGRPVKLCVEPLESAEKRSLDELRSFKEVHFN